MYIGPLSLLSSWLSPDPPLPPSYQAIFSALLLSWSFYYLCSSRAILHCKNVSDFPVPSRDFTNKTGLGTGKLLAFLYSVIQCLCKLTGVREVWVEPIRRDKKPWGSCNICSYSIEPLRTSFLSFYVYNSVFMHIEGRNICFPFYAFVESPIERTFLSFCSNPSSIIRFF
jgi:hypothetical protein